MSLSPLDIDGLVAATATPMHSDGSLNLDIIKPQVDFLASQGIKGLYILGSTGEGFSLTDDERMEVTEAFVKANQQRLKLFVQVGHNSWRASALLAAHAQASGVDAISATPPGYFKPDGVEALCDGLEIITSAAPNTPFYYYHIPALSDVHIDVCQFIRTASARMDSFVGIKYSDGSTLYNLQSMLETVPGKEFLAGSDEAYLMSLAQGYRGAVGSTYGYGAPIYRKVRESFEAGNMDEARRWQHRAMLMIDAMLSTCGRAGLKAMWSLVGVDCGPVRAPIAEATPEQINELRTRLEAIEFFEWCASDLQVAI